MNKIAISTLGCKVNQVESNSIIQQFKAKGWEIVDFNDLADIYLVNTCTVTGRADFKSRNLIRQAIRKKSDNPQIKIIVTGCYSQKETQEIEKLGDIDLIVDNLNKTEIDTWLNNREYNFEEIIEFDELKWTNVSSIHEKSRAYVKIQDGCDYFCSYCAVPYARGKPRSLPMENILQQVTNLVKSGFKEIILTGINIGLYQDPLYNNKLADVLKGIIDIEHSILLRISSLEINQWNQEVLEIISNYQNICPHFHLPVQSGSNRVLALMKRKYESSDVLKLVAKLLEIRSDCAVGFDVICGFPGESENDFSQTYNLIESLPIAYLHVFKYSNRKSTAASIMNNQISPAVIEERAKTINVLGNEKKEKYKEKLAKENVLLMGIVEKNINSEFTFLSDHYVRAYGKGKYEPGNLLSGNAERQYKDGLCIKSAFD